MQISFQKFQGCGNDFIIIDNRKGEITLSNQRVEILCDRHFGIGADGLMLLETAPGYDFKMVYYNSDGNVSSLCGNGSRCITRFAQSLGIIKDKAHFLASDGEHYSVINGEEITLHMANVNKIEDKGDFLFLNTGSPHVVKWVTRLEEYDVFGEGRKIRESEPYKSNGGTNVNFIEQTPDGIFIRTYERGVENETLACGTGVTAAALVASQFNRATSANSCKVKTLGGNLSVDFKNENNSFRDIWLKGPAEFVFKGEVGI
ncbi:MAG TPA: diaminopimelate epimerase [Bacteroidia bacterium]|jgi:diaminopimelate epimerase|nr:diaminopimelate epimerase [Bacteroidia bacterium]